MGKILFELVKGKHWFELLIILPFKKSKKTISPGACSKNEKNAHFRVAGKVKVGGLAHV